MATTDTPPDSPSKTPERSPPPRSPDPDWAQVFLSAAAAASLEANGNGNSSTKAKARAAETAVDDTEDLFDDDVVEEKRKTGGYTRRRQSNHRSGRNGAAASRKFAKVEAVLPFSFHPNIQPLTISDLDSCVALEEAAFADPAHRCTREKVRCFLSRTVSARPLFFSSCYLKCCSPVCIRHRDIPRCFRHLLILPHDYDSTNVARIFEYRLTTCPELCLGLFCTVVPSEIKDTDFEISTLPTAHPVETGRADGAKSVLLAHIVSTRSNDMVVTDAAMDYPRDFRTLKGRNDTGLGHQANGKTVCLHSVAVHPKVQGCGLGKLIMKAYLQQQKGSAAAQRCALICQEHLVKYYERFHFEHLGLSLATFGGGGWHDMLVAVHNIPPYSTKPPR
ncbi:acyl-CoA N-acyltransferase [Hypoxylon cercidicola]|nr:acyl-CoA N-acyltransferase [Hypoxylon cercidicola]